MSVQESVVWRARSGLYSDFSINAVPMARRRILTLPKE